MDQSQGYLRHLSIILLISLYSIQQVSSIKCYHCDSRSNPQCLATDSTLSRFLIECPRVYISRASSNSSQLIKQDDQASNLLEYDCAYARGISTLTGTTIVTRGCTVKAVTCDTFKIHFAAVNSRTGDSFQVDTCRRCDKDMCNSSGHLSTGILSITLSLLALYFIKF